MGRFVLFRIARDIASQQGDLVTALDAIDRIAGEFDTDKLQMQVDAAATAIKATKQPKANQAIVGVLAPLIDQAVADDRYDIAKSIAALALGCAKEGRDGNQIKQIAAGAKEIEEIASAFEKVKEAVVVLNAKPADPAANATVGRFRCFAKGDWQSGVSMLAIGIDTDFKEVALLELEETPDALKLGDGWWKISENLEGIAKSRAQAHAVDWYRIALPGLNGLSKAKIQKRVAEHPETTDANIKTRPAKANQSYPSIKGVWQEVPGVLFEIAQQGQQFTATTIYKDPKAGEIRAIVKGTISKDGRIVAMFFHTKAPPNWTKEQRREGLLSADMKTIHGRAFFDGKQHEFVWTRQE